MFDLLLGLDIDHTLINFLSRGVVEWNGGKELWQGLCKELKETAIQHGGRIHIVIITSKHGPEINLREAATELGPLLDDVVIDGNSIPFSPSTTQYYAANIDRSIQFDLREPSSPNQNRAQVSDIECNHFHAPVHLTRRKIPLPLAEVKHKAADYRKKVKVNYPNIEDRHIVFAADKGNTVMSLNKVIVFRCIAQYHSIKDYSQTFMVDDGEIILDNFKRAGITTFSAQRLKELAIEEDNIFLNNRTLYLERHAEFLEMRTTNTKLLVSKIKETITNKILSLTAQDKIETKKIEGENAKIATKTRGKRKLNIHSLVAQKNPINPEDPPGVTDQKTDEADSANKNAKTETVCAPS